MVFSSFVFLCFFLPIVLILHTLVKNQQFRNGLLILASVFFYAYGEPVYVILLLLSVGMNYGFGRLAADKKNKAAAVLAVIVNIGLLVIFKYTGLLVDTWNSLAPASLALKNPEIDLPIGISFYTFQALSYVLDVYWGKEKVQKNFFSLLLYISFFPQLIAGPIVKYHDVAEQISKRVVTAEKMRSGIYRFCVGLSKKILISNAVAYVADSIFALQNDQIGLLSSWLAAISYLMQIYFDFSGYSDMAIGLGRMFGFDFLENFNYPYMADSIQEFWHRWHISLSTWFKEYLYIPLGGNRKGNARAYLNRYIVFAATGIWHGANWTFLCWGLFHGTFLVLESANIIPIKKCRFKPVRVLYTLLLVTIGFVLFRSDSILQAGYMIKAMFGFGAKGGIGLSTALSFLSPYYIFIFLLTFIGCTDYPKRWFNKLVPAGMKNADGQENTVSGKKIAGQENTVRQGKNSVNNCAGELVRMALCIAAMILCYMSLASDSYNPFIYFRF